MPSVAINAVPVEPDEFIVDTSTVTVYVARVVPAFRLVQGYNLLTADSSPLGLLSAVGG